MKMLAFVLLFLSFAFPADVVPFLKPSFLNLKEDLEESRRENKLLFLMFHQEGCPFCDKMRRVTFQDKKVQEYFKKHFYMVEVDIRGSNEVTDLDGKKLTEKQFAIKHGIRLTPVFLFFDQQGNVIVKVPGYIEPQEFILLGRYVVEGHYKRKNLVQYIKENKGR
ncbi:MAG: thioredoxin family protein [Aquificaceae bacterium]|nr:thioredoxin family protein [Aquificaceae bacterium]MCX8060765.1 thioredoxin family protein [Aquificaceae bacterium]MDW8097613.1 thioredoxin family protein [Aquificaceae bacterium]